MLFRRRDKLHPIQYARDFLWPRIGWRRSTLYISHRVARLPGTPYSIAAGFACGAALSFTPFIGFHFAGAALLAWLIGGNLLASALGTMIGNPWTYPFIWPWLYLVGNWLLGVGTEGGPPQEMGVSMIFDHPAEVFFTMTVGSIPTGLVAWLVFFWPVKRLVTAYQHHLALRRARKKQQERFERLAGEGALRKREEGS